MAEPHGRAPQMGSSGASSSGVGSSFPLRVLWFSGLFSKHRRQIDMILEPLRNYLRYARRELCLVRFRDRLTLQTGQNVKDYHRKGLIGDPGGGPLPLGVG